MKSKPAPVVDQGRLDPDTLFRSLAGRRGLVLAVSGGPDSTALMYLVSRWRERPPTLVVSVDHGLRPESAAEARLVEENAARLGLAAKTARAGEPPLGNLQDWARRVRYRRLIGAAHEAGFDTIVTAHHEDDQAETFLLRLARGSGVYGLSAMREEEAIDGVRLSRPLLRVPRKALLKAAAESGLETLADPSNLQPRFDRVRMRTLMPALAAEGLDAPRLAGTAARLARAARALDHYATELLKSHFEVDWRGTVAGPAAVFKVVPEEVALRALSRIVRAVSGAEYTPALAAAETLLAAILSAREAGTTRRTLSGAVMSVSSGRFTAEREWGRGGPVEIAAPAGAVVFWDGRFRVPVPDRPGRLSVAALGHAERLWKRSTGGSGPQATLPGLYQDGTLVAAPPGVAARAAARPLDILAVECIVGQRLGTSEDH